MSTNDMTFSVIICAHTEERWEALVEAVESVLSQTLRPCEIIVSVDHNDQLLARIRAELKDVIAVENVEARGPSGAKNSALPKASGAIIAFLDDDAKAAPDWLARLGEGYADPRVLGVGGCIEPHWIGSCPAWFPEEFNWVVGCTYRGLPQGTAPVRNLIGANMSFRREVFESLDGFSQSIGKVRKTPAGGRCEETEFCIRVHQHWPQSILIHKMDPKVYHQVPQSRTTLSFFFSRCYHEGVAKALVTGFVGTRAGLSSEFAYTLRTLPLGIGRNLVQALIRRDPTRVARAGVTIAGFATTTAGYVIGKLTDRL